MKVILPMIIKPLLIASNIVLWKQIVATIILIGVFIMLTRENVPRSYVALIGASLVIILRIIPPTEALSAINLGVLSTIIGVMLMTESLSRTGLFDSLAWFLAMSSKRNSRLLHSLLVITTYVLSMLINNIATMLIMIPITIKALKKLGINPRITLMTEAIVVNIGGIGLPVSSIPNVMVCIESNLSTIDFLREITPVSIALLFVCLFLSLKGVPKVMLPASLSESAKIKVDLNFIRYFAAFIIGVILIVGYDEIGLPLPVASLIAGGLALLVSGGSPRLFKEIDWPTIFFLSGIFVVIRGAEDSGLLILLSHALSNTIQRIPQLAIPLILWLSALASALIDNIPITATLIPVISGLKTVLTGHIVWWSLILGANLGGNFTAIGSPSNIIMMGMSKRYGVNVTFKEFSKFGAKHTVIYLALCTTYLYVFYLIIR